MESPQQGTSLLNIASILKHDHRTLLSPFHEVTAERNLPAALAGKVFEVQYLVERLPVAPSGGTCPITAPVALTDQSVGVCGEYGI